MVTLTYPRVWSGDPADWKRDLDVWLKRLLRRCPGASGVWKLEPQGRGAPHFHLLLWGVGYLDHQWVARSWWDVCGRASRDHLRAGTRVEAVRHSHCVGSYVSKYAGKSVDSPGNWPEYPGRYWGWFRRSATGRVLAGISCSERQWFALRRVLRGLLERRLSVSRGTSTWRGTYDAGDSRAGMWAILDADRAEELLALFGDL